MFLEGISNVKKGFDGSITAIKAKDTIKSFRDNLIKSTLNRNELLIVQTPQTFIFDKLKKAHQLAIQKNIVGTDDSYLMEILNYKITYNEGSPLNIKITTKEDLILANCILRVNQR